jgi:hypothetical protein
VIAVVAAVALPSARRRRQEAVAAGVEDLPSAAPGNHVAGGPPGAKVST